MPNKLAITLASRTNSERQIRITRKECLVIGLSGLMAFFAWDASFNMQVLIPVVVYLLHCFIGSGSQLNKTGLSLCCAIVASSCMSSFISCFVDSKIVDAKSILRILYFIEILVYYLVITSRSFAKEDVHLIIVCNVVTGAAIALGTIANYLFGGEGKLAPINIWGVELAENGTGAILAFDIVLAMMMLTYTRGIKKRFVLILSVAAMGFATLLTGSRAAYIGVGIGCVVILFQLLSDARFHPVTKIAIIILIVSCVLVFLHYAESILPQFTYERLFDPNYDDRSNADRMAIWRFGLAGIMQRMLFGYGIGNYNYYVINELGMREHVAVVAHNTYLDFLLDFGIVGTTLVLYLIVRNFRGLVKQRACLPLLLVLGFTAAIVGAERSYFFWNEIILITLICQTLGSKGTKKDAAALFDPSGFSMWRRKSKESGADRSKTATCSRKGIQGMGSSVHQTNQVNN